MGGDDSAAAAPSPPPEAQPDCPEPAPPPAEWIPPVIPRIEEDWKSGGAGILAWGMLAASTGPFTAALLAFLSLYV